ncbi:MULTISPECIES: Sec-independent protein translocase protein TatB [unclassified Yoonia]|uniref:Sec-independent protein translocase protein TatB n=1 Tax=unclassified Yoonia TaxID=2629118 RepID=UPI002AFE0154|nr:MULTISPECIES: Sec-independent protein translocase protein TatB [unclassified Yoonia]
MFGLGMSEMVLIGIVALIVIGPKDLPGMFRALGQFTGKARGMAREFSRAMEAAADESGIKEMSNTIRAASDPKKFGADALKDATSFSKGPATQELAAQRKAAKAKMTDDLAKTQAETAARAAVKAAPAKPETAKAPAKKPAPRKAAPPKPVADKPEDKA